MFKLNVFNSPIQFWKQTTSEKVPNTSNVHKANNSNAINNNNNKHQILSTRDKSRVISMNHSEDDDFVEVQIKKLSYAEVAALSRTTTDVVGGDVGDFTGDLEQTPIVDQHDLESEVTDYQMSSVLGKNSLRKSRVDEIVNAAVPATGESDTPVVDVESLHDDLHYNDKNNRRTKKAKFLKKGK